MYTFEEHEPPLNLLRPEQRGTRTPHLTSGDGGPRGEVEKGSPTPKNAVIIYSRRDARVCEELEPHLSPLEKHHRIDRFDDALINPGWPWREEIGSALNSVQVAVLLVSQRFLTSPFILDEQLPLLLRRASRGGVTILSLILTPCAYERSMVLTRFQPVNDPSCPLSGMRRHNRDAVYDRLAKMLEYTLR